jgi:hypothetical protein
VGPAVDHRKRGFLASWSWGPAGGILNLAVGVACVVGGLSGKVRLIGTESATPLFVLGGFLVGIGALRTWRWRVRARRAAERAAERAEEEFFAAEEPPPDGDGER